MQQRRDKYHLKTYSMIKLVVNIIMKSWFLFWNAAAFIKFIDTAIQQWRH
jgi:hypothetical protein